MSTPEFLSRLYQHPATSELALALAEVLVLRGRADLVPFAFVHATRRVAS